MPKKLLNDAHVCEADENGRVSVAKHVGIDTAADGGGRDIVHDIVEVTNGKPAVRVHGLKQWRCGRQGVVIFSEIGKVKFDGGADGAGHVNETAALGFCRGLRQINRRADRFTPKNGIDVQRYRLAGA